MRGRLAAHNEPHLSTVASVGKEQTYAFGQKKGKVPAGQETAPTADLAWEQQPLRETAERLRRLPSHSLNEASVRACLLTEVERPNEAAAIVVVAEEKWRRSSGAVATEGMCPGWFVV